MFFQRGEDTSERPDQVLAAEVVAPPSLQRHSHGRGAGYHSAGCTECLLPAAGRHHSGYRSLVRRILCQKRRFFRVWRQAVELARTQTAEWNLSGEKDGEP